MVNLFDLSWKGNLILKKILWFDCETSGLDPVKNDIIQLAGVIEIDGKLVDEFDFKCQPYSYENVDQGALDVHGITIEQIKQFELAKVVQSLFTKKLAKYCDKFDRNDKFYPAGYNCKFDIDFIAQWFKKAGDNYLGSWLNWRALDPLPLLCLMEFKGKISLPNYKLATVAEYYKIPLEAHNAISDIKATREIFRIVCEELKI